MFRKLKSSLLFAGLLASTFLQAQTNIDLQLNKPGVAIQPTMWGIFFEDINFAADGGLYAELVKNRSFSFDDPMMGWKTFSKDSIRIINEVAAGTQKRFVRLSALKSGTENFLQNDGFRGMGLHEGEEYRLTLHVRAVNGVAQKLKVELLGDDKMTIAEGELTVDGEDWGYAELVLKTREV